MASKKRTQSKNRKKPTSAAKSRVNKGLKSKAGKKKTGSVKKKVAARAAKSKAPTRKTAKKGKKVSAKKSPAKTGTTTRSKAAKKKKLGRAKAARRTVRTGRTGRPTSRQSTQRPRLSTFSAALKLYEGGVKLMQAEKFIPAKAAFDGLIKEYPNETELVDRATVLIQACDNRIQEMQESPRLKGADQYYEIGVAELNSRELDKALEHLKEALRLSPKADHVLYALAAASALSGQREAALDSLGKAIQYREENRFLAVNDDDFESLADDEAFIKLVS